MSRQEGHVLGLSCHLKQYPASHKTLTGYPEMRPGITEQVSHWSWLHTWTFDFKYLKCYSSQASKEPKELSKTSLHATIQKAKHHWRAYQCKEQENCSGNSAASWRQNVFHRLCNVKVHELALKQLLWVLSLSPFCIRQENGSIGLTVSP